MCVVLAYRLSEFIENIWLSGFTVFFFLVWGTFGKYSYLSLEFLTHVLLVYFAILSFYVDFTDSGNLWFFSFRSTFLYLRSQNGFFILVKAEKS